MGRDDKSTVVRPIRIARGRAAGQIACIEVQSGSAKGRLLPLTTGSTLIGRGSTTDLMLDDDGVSRQHAKVSVSEDGIVNLIDLDSTNGCFVNGSKVDIAIVRDGDRIQIGPDVVLQLAFVEREEIARRRRPSPETAERLSKRETEVAVLVAEGLTSQEVADRLHISPRTVTTHLSNMYERLGLSGRAALARYVVQNGLLGG